MTGFWRCGVREENGKCDKRDEEHKHAVQRRDNPELLQQIAFYEYECCKSNSGGCVNHERGFTNFLNNTCHGAHFISMTNELLVVFCKQVNAIRNTNNDHEGWNESHEHGNRVVEQRNSTHRYDHTNSNNNHTN